MCEILCITNRRLCAGDFLLRIEQIAQSRPAGIVLREKDLPQAEYAALAADVMAVCRRYGVRCILHSFAETAAELGAAAIHLPLPVLRETEDALLRRFAAVGVSVHAPEEAAEAQARGASYVTAGHIYATDCKKGLAGRGTGFLREVCERVQIPVFAIGGITPENAGDVMAAGARGICLMSSLMQCEDPAALMKAVSQHGETAYLHKNADSEAAGLKGV